MTKEQIQYLRETYNSALPGKETPAATSVFYHLHGSEVVIRNNMEFIVFDDDKELVHAITTSRENNGKHEAPYSILSASYDLLDITEANMTMDSLFALLDSMFASLITDEQKAQIKSWAQRIPNSPISPVISTYISDDPAEVPPHPVTVGTRPDGVYSNGYPVERAPKKATITIITPDKLTESIADGANIFLKDSTEITDPVNIENDSVTLNLNASNVSNTMTISGDNNTLKGAVLTTVDFTDDNANILVVTGDGFELTNSTFDLVNESQKVAAAVMMNTDMYSLNEIDVNCDQNVINFIDNDGSIKTKKVTVKNCTFRDKAVAQYLFSFYDFVDGAVVSFENCSFTVSDGSNPVRISNKSNAKVTMNFINCKYKSDANEKAALIALVDDTPTAYVKTAEELIAAVEAGDKIVLENDITLSQNLVIDGFCSIDLNNKTLTFNTGSNARPMQIGNNGAVTITNGYLQNDFENNYGIADNTGNVTLINVYCDLVGGDGGAVFRNMNNGHITVYGGTFKNAGTNANQLFRNHHNCADTYLEINDATIICESLLDYGVVLRSGICVLNGCTITGKHGGISAETGVCYVNDCISSSEDYYGLYISNTYGDTDVTVNGTKFTGKTIDILGTAPDGDSQGSKQKGNVNITINDAICEHCAKLNKTENTKGFVWSMKIYGGTYGQDPSAYVDPEAAEVKDNGDGTWTVTPINEIASVDMRTPINEDAPDDNDFSKVTINIKNLTIENKVVTKNDTIDLSKRVYRLEGTKVEPVVNFS